jgi:hypothetical protein
LAKTGPELSIASLVRGSFQQPKLLAQRHENIRSFKQRERKINISEDSIYGAAATRHEFGYWAERTCAGES